jgi:hypothetical protein
MVCRALHLPVSSSPWFLCLLQLAVLMAMPGVFHHLALSRNGALPAVALYACWWVVGAIVAMYGMLLRRIDFTDAPRIDPFGRNRVVVGAFLLLGMISILGHLCTSNWIYGVRWYTANLAPLMLGLTVACGALPEELLRYRKRVQLQICLPLAAVAMSAAFPTHLEFGPTHLMPLTPLRLALVAAAVACLHGLCTGRQPIFAWMSLACLLTASMGSSAAAIVQNLIQVNRRAAEAVEAIAPRRALHWGVMSMMLSFALLALGWLVSLWKSRHHAESDPLPFRDMPVAEVLQRKSA